MLYGRRLFSRLTVAFVVVVVTCVVVLGAGVVILGAGVVITFLEPTGPGKLAFLAGP